MNETKVWDLARGKWQALLGQYLTERTLAGKHGPCPMCGGKDRFRISFVDSGEALWLCNHCGQGNGIHLLQQINGWDFAEVAKHIELNAGRFQARPTNGKSMTDPLVALKRAWEGSQRVEEGDPVHKYLTHRCGAFEPTSAIRFHPRIPYRHEDESVTYHPAMLAQVLGWDGSPISIHRTYLSDDGQKAAVPSQKKLMSPTRKMENCAIRLAKPTEGALGVAEGIETAICASLRFRMPVWSCISAGMMETFKPPAGVDMLAIFADNDVSFTGQASAFKLARIVKAFGVDCKVSIPDCEGDDYADEHIKLKNLWPTMIPMLR